MIVGGKYEFPVNREQKLGTSGPWGLVEHNLENETETLKLTK